MPTPQPVLIAVEQALVGSRLAYTVSLLDIRDGLNVHEDLPVWWARQLRTVLLREGHDYAPGQMVSRTADHFRDIRLTVSAARQMLGPIRSTKATLLKRDLVAWEQAMAAEDIDPTDTPAAERVRTAHTPHTGSTPTEFAEIGTLCAATVVTIGGRSVLGVADARSLHTGLAVGRDYTNWIKDRIARFGFVEGEDFEVISHSPIPASGNRGARTDYAITLDMAKELAMVENNDLGRLVRRYFIWLERNQHGETLHAQPTITSDQQAWAAWLALPLAERRCRQRDITIIGRTHGVAGMRHAMKRVGLPPPPTYAADGSGQFEMPFRQISAARTISDPPEGSA